MIQVVGILGAAAIAVGLGFSVVSVSKPLKGPGGQALLFAIAAVLAVRALAGFKKAGGLKGLKGG